MSRRWWGALAGLLAVALTLVGSPARADAGPGATGHFTYAYAVDPFPVLDHQSVVRFGVASWAGVANVDVRDETGVSQAFCYQGTECDVLANPGPGQTKTYTAHYTVVVNNVRVERSTATVSVTDPGWTGTITPLATNKEFVPAGSAVWLSYSTTAPRAMVDVNTYVDGVLNTTCDAQGGDLYCSANFVVAANTVHVVRADVLAYLGASPREVRATATTIVTSMTPQGLAQHLLDASPAQLQAELGPELAARVVELQQAVAGPSFCLSLGLRFPTYRLGMTIPDLTAVCEAGPAAAMAVLFSAIGINAALTEAKGAADDPANLDPSDPFYPAGGGIDTDETLCRQYDFDGNCIEGLEADPEPELQVAADGARIPPPSNCMSDAARDTWVDETHVQDHHIITQYDNQAKPGASDVQIEKSLDVDRLQTIAAWYGLNWADGQWNLISIPHKGPHPPAYHSWLRQQVAAIDTVAQGDPVVFLGLWDLLVRDTIASDPSIVGYDYWNCYG